MKILNLDKRFAAIAGAILSLPSAYFILINLMKFEFGSPGLYDASWPLFQSLGAEGSFGWNINLLIVFGPVLAFALNALSLMNIHYETTRDSISCQVTVAKTPFNLAVLILSAGLLLILMAYLLAENCHCG